MYKNDFRKLLAASFISQAGSHFLTLVLASFVFIQTGSPIRSALVFVLSFMPAVFVSTRIGALIDRKLSLDLLVKNELLSILATVLCVGCISLALPLPFLCIILSARSILLFTSRAATTKWLKLITSSQEQSQRIKLFFLAFFLSTAVSGLAAAMLLKSLSVWTLAALDALSFLIAIGILSRLSPLQVESTSPVTSLESESPSTLATLREILSSREIALPFTMVLASQMLFQGAYSALVTTLPIKVLKLGIDGVGYFQLAASFGIIVGFLANWLRPSLLVETGRSLPKAAFVTATLALGSGILSVTSPFVGLSILAFFAMNFLYECIWLHFSSEFFRVCPSQTLARYQFTLNSVASFGMAISTLLFAYSLEGTAPEKSFSSTVALFAIALAVILGSFLKVHFAPRAVEGAL